LGALAGKASHLGAPTLGLGDRPEPDSVGVGPDTLTAAFVVTNAHGLHARPASRVVQAVRMLDARVALRNRTTGSAWVPAASLSKVATLGALCGHEIEVRVSGNQGREALDHLLTLAARGFDDDLDARGGVGNGGRTAEPTPLPHAGPIAASPGVGIGPAWSMHAAPIDLTGAVADDPAVEWRRLKESLATVRRHVQRVRARAAREVGEAEAAIFDAHLLLLDDADLLDEVRTRVDEGQAAAPAWADAVGRVAAELTAIPDPYLQARATDVSAIGDAVLRELLGVSTGDAVPTGVLVAADLTPTEAAELDPSRVSAVVLAFGSPTAHSAILLRARGIPGVVAAGAGVLGIPEGTVLAVDGGRGELVTDPPADLQASFRARAAEQARWERQALVDATSPAVTRNGVPILLGANIGSLQDARMAAEYGADLAGLVRTEFLFLGRSHAPDVDEQEAAYRQISDALGKRRVTFRTLDVGGDKPLGYLPMPAEANPFLGLRGIRLSLARPRLLAHQLLALVRVAHDAPVTVMFPMISTLDELTRARRMLDDAIKLAGRGEPADLQVGIMVEVPATALKTRAFAPHVDLLSIGTNDLTQYAMAAERGNDAVAGIADPFDPGVLALIDAVCRGADGSRAIIAVCGELAADERAAGLLIGLGVRELSVTPRAVPTIKQTIRGLDSGDCAVLASKALVADSPGTVRNLASTARRPT
jgi:phosphoenolpyruvate-protein phosphotransferase